MALAMCGQRGAFPADNARRPDWTLLLVRGLGHFWPATLEEVTLSSGETFAGQVYEVALPQQSRDERLYFTGNQDIDGARWRWVAIDQIVEGVQLADLIVLIATLGRLLWVV